MTDWLSLAKDIMLPAGFGLVQQVSCGVETVPEDQRGCGSDPVSSPALQPKLPGPAGKIHPLPEPSRVPFIDRIHWFLDMRYAELAGEEAPWGDRDTSLARERGY